MADNSEIQWFPVVTLLLGFVSSAVVDFLKDFRNSKAAFREKVDEREYLAKHKRNEFQFENLIAVQDSIARFLRANGEAQHHDTIEYHKSGTWGHSQINSELNQRLLDENVLLIKLSSRVHNEEVRSLIGELRKMHTNNIFTKNEKDSMAAMSEMAKIAGNLHDIIGQEVRKFPD